MASRKVVCWDPSSILHRQLHFIQLFRNILPFVAIFMQMTLKYTYRFLLNWLLLLSHLFKFAFSIFFRGWLETNCLLILIKLNISCLIKKNINVPVSINLNLNTISSSECAKNLDVIFQSDMSKDKHISSVVKTCFHQFSSQNLLLLYLQMSLYIPA